jgi:DMSO/TMAO reductase YedYZ molybdopterin-dependent catalytic subunit
VPDDPVIAIRGAVTEAFDLPLATLATLPRRELIADFHCVAGWSTTDLRWEGVSFETVYRSVVEPALPPATAVTHVLFRGLDGYASVILLEDALADGSTATMARRLGWSVPVSTAIGAPSTCAASSCTPASRRSGRPC